MSGDSIVRRELAIAMLGIHESLLLLQSTEEVLYSCALASMIDLSFMYFDSTTHLLQHFRTISILYSRIDCVTSCPAIVLSIECHLIEPESKDCSIQKRTNVILLCDFS
jgi:hypothetical protein